MQFIPSIWEDCVTVPLQIAFLKHYIDLIALGTETPDISDLKRRVSTLEVDSDNVEHEINYIKQVLDAHQEQILQANETANNALDIGNSAKTTAESAQTTADSAMTTANNSLQTATRANDNATEAKTTADAAATDASEALTTANSAKAKAIATQNQVNQLTTQIQNNTTEISTIKSDLDLKQDLLVFDTTPLAGSNNPVTSDGIAKAIEASGGGPAGGVVSVVTPEGRNAVNGIAVTNYVKSITDPMESEVMSAGSLAKRANQDIYVIKQDIVEIQEAIDKKEDKSDLTIRNDIDYITYPDNVVGNANAVINYTKSPSYLALITNGSFEPTTEYPIVNSLKPPTTEAVKSYVKYLHDSTESNIHKLFETTGENTRQISNLDTEKQDKLTFDDTPTIGSSNPVTSEGIRNYVAESVNSIPGMTVDQEVTEESNNAVSSSGVYKYVNEHAPQITVDQEVTSTSENPISSKGVFTYMEDEIGTIQSDIGAVDNKAVANGEAIQELQTNMACKQDTLTFDQIPTENSSNPVTSAGIKKYVDAASSVSIDPTGPSEGSTAFVNSGQVYKALIKKQDTIGILTTDVSIGRTTKLLAMTVGGVKLTADQIPDITLTLPKTVSFYDNKNVGTKSPYYMTPMRIRLTYEGTRSDLRGYASYQPRYIEGSDQWDVVMQDGSSMFTLNISTGTPTENSILWLVINVPLIFEIPPTEPAMVMNRRFYDDFIEVVI